MKNYLIINCKTYGKATGTLAQNIAKAIMQIQKKRNVEIILAVPATEIYKTAQTKVKVIAQHVDGKTIGAHTGSVLAEDIKHNKAKGSLINHSEDPYTMPNIKQAIERLKENKLISIVCSPTAQKAKQIASFKPDIIAIEPPKLIGGNISVSTANPKIITNTIKKVHEVANIPVLVGAGIKTTEDVKIALQLGARGILVASGITKAKNYKKAIQELLDGFE